MAGLGPPPPLNSGRRVDRGVGLREAPRARLLRWLPECRTGTIETTPAGAQVGRAAVAWFPARGRPRRGSPLWICGPATCRPTPRDPPGLCSPLALRYPDRHAAPARRGQRALGGAHQQRSDKGWIRGRRVHNGRRCCGSASLSRILHDASRSRPARSGRPDPAQAVARVREYVADSDPHRPGRDRGASAGPGCWRRRLPRKAVRERGTRGSHQVLLRRPGHLLSDTLELGTLRLDTASRQVTIGNRPQFFSPREVAVLEILLRRSGRVIAKKLVEDHLFGLSGDVGSNAVEVYVHRLRKQLADADADVEIHTIRGVGYLIAG